MERKRDDGDMTCKMMAEILSTDRSPGDGVLGLMNLPGNYYYSDICPFDRIQAMKYAFGTVEEAWENISCHLVQALNGLEKTDKTMSDMETAQIRRKSGSVGNELQPRDPSSIKKEIISLIRDRDLSDKEKERRITDMLNAESYSGPVPPPSYLEGYRSVIPDAPERFLRMAETEQTANLELQKNLADAQKSNVRNAYRANLMSQIFAFILIVIFVAAGVYLTETGHDTVGGIIFGTTIVGVAGLFITGTYLRRKRGE